MMVVNRVRGQSAPSDSAATRVLVYAEAWGKGGIESFLMNLFRRLQGNGFAFNLFTTWEWNDGFDDELAELGIGRWTSFPNGRPGQAKRLREGPAAYGRLIEDVGCDVSYVNTMNGMGFLWADAARKHGVPTRAVHSHNSTYGSGSAGLKKAAHFIGRAALGSAATVRLACSEDAGRYLFGNQPFEIVNNGIDTSHFAFDEVARNSLRDELGIPADTLLFGSVGRIEEAKNPLFQIRVFERIHDIYPRSRYLMVGDGDMLPEVRSQVAELGLSDAVVLPGYLPDPAAIYSALDCFLMPSLYEGLPMTCVECQCSGCPMIVTDGITQQAIITDIATRVPLGEGELAWAKAAVSEALEPHNRSSYSQRVASAGFDADCTAQLVSRVLDGGER